MAAVVMISVPFAAAVAVGIVVAAIAAPVARTVAVAEAEARVAVVARAPSVPRSAHRPAPIVPGRAARRAPIVPRPAGIARRGGGGGRSGGKHAGKPEGGKQAFPNHADTPSALAGPLECGREYWRRDWRAWPEPGLIATFMQGSAWRSGGLRA